MEKKLYDDIFSLGETDVNTDDNNKQSNVYSNKSLELEATWHQLLTYARVCYIYFLSN